MASWKAISDEITALQPDKRAPRLDEFFTTGLKDISRLRGGNNVMIYGSGWLQKQQVPPSFLFVSPEDINGFMAVMNGMDWDRGLTLILHTPGGVTSAAQTIVEYLIQKFEYIEVIIPTYAMSAGTMMALASNKIVMGRQSQLGPIDPQLHIGNMPVSARAIMDQWRAAKKKFADSPESIALYAPILQKMGPALLAEAKRALSYSQDMVERWLVDRHFAGKTDGPQLAANCAKYFNISKDHTSHGRRIDRTEARSQHLDVEDLEDNDDLQDAVLTVYHAMTIIFELSPAAKLIAANHGPKWIKNLPMAPPRR